MSQPSKVETGCELPALPPMNSSPGEHSAVVRTHWIEGIRVYGRLQSDAAVAVHRLYGDIPDEKYLEYYVELELDNQSEPMTFTVEGAQQLGAALLRAAATVLTDTAQNSSYLTD